MSQRMVKKPMSQVCVAVVAAVCLFASACGGGADESSDGLAFENIRDGQENMSRIRPYESIEELVSQTVANRSDQRAVDYVVLGRVVDVERGSSFRWVMDEEIGEAAREELAFGSPGAQIDTAHLTVEVSEIIAAGAGVPEPAKLLTVGVAMDADIPFDSIARDFSSLTRTVLFLRAGTPVFDYEDDLLAIVEDGALLATVDDDEILNFPVLDGAEELRANSGLTIDTLRNASNRDG